MGSAGRVAVLVVIGVAAAHATASPAGAGTPAGPPAAAAIAYAKAQLGKPYVWGGPTAPGTSYGFDCSGLVYEAYGTRIPRTSEAQWAGLPHVSTPQPGDLVFFAGSDGTMTSPGHVGIVIGGGEMVDAPHTGTDVQVEPYANAADLVGYARPETG